MAETKQCPKCKEPIDATAKRCKHCQADLRNWFVRHKIMTGGLVLLLLIIVAAASGGDSDSSSSSSTSSSTGKSDEIEIVSKSFDDYDTYCDLDATTLQKETEFKEEFEDKYVEWTGTVEYVDDGSIQVKHCDSTLISDIIISMKDGQNDELIKLKEGDEITYQAKITDYGEILGLSGADGMLVKK